MKDFSELFGDVLNIFIFLGEYFVFWAPFIFGAILWHMWRSYLLKKWLSKTEWVLLEIKLPKEIKKTPLAMEVVLAALYQAGTGEWYDQLFKGRVMDWSSLEIASIGGSVHFFIRVSSVYKNIIESQIYSQYPDAEVYEVPDYSKYLNYYDDNSEWQMWAQEYKLKKLDAYPIRTYVDFGIDKEGIKDEEKVDPMTPTLELLGSIRSDEQLWMQILIQPAKKRFSIPGKRFKKCDWRGEGEDAIEDIRKKRIEKMGGAGGEKADLTPTEEEVVKAIQRNISKLGFDCGIRTIYWVKKDGKFEVSRVKGLLNLFNQYNSNTLNSFGNTSTTGFDDFPWQDFKGVRVRSLKRRMFNAYKRRSYFYPPRKCKPFVLNIEELATIYHFPGQVAETPTFGRIESRKGEPPINLPT